MSKKILITGGFGFIGKHVVQEFINNGDKIHVLDNLSTGQFYNFTGVATHCPVDVLKINEITNDFDVIIHLAAQSRVVESIKNPFKTLNTNLNGTLQVLEFARKNNTRIVFAGSASVHHNAMNSPYALSKKIGEDLCKLYMQTYGLRCDIIRFYNVFGPGESETEEHGSLIGIWKRRALQGLPLIIRGDGTQRRDFIYVSDIAKATRIISSTHEDNYDWELGSGQDYSVNEVFDFFNARFNNKLTKMYEGELDKIQVSNLKNNEAHKLLNWKSTLTVSDYVSGPLLTRDNNQW